LAVPLAVSGGSWMVDLVSAYGYLVGRIRSRVLIAKSFSLLSQEQQPESEGCSEALVAFGNRMARASDSFTDASLVVIAAGVTVGATGFPQVGAAITAAGATGGAWFGGGLRLMSGLAHGFGGMGFDNSRNALGLPADS
jgi:hypothetical protein